MDRRTALSVAVAVASIVLGVASEWVLFGLSAVGSWMPDALVGWAVIASGLVAAGSAGGRRSALLLLATGTAWFVDDVMPWPTYLHRATLVHVVLTYPNGRLRSRPVAAVVAGGYAVALIPAVWGSPVVTLLLASTLGAASLWVRWESVGSPRREATYAASLAVGVAVILAVTAVIHLGAPGGGGDGFALHLYEAGIAAVGLGAALGLRSRPWGQVAVTDLVLELGEARSATLGEALARACGDPRLKIGYWVPESGSFVDASGEPFDVPGVSDRQRATTFVERDGEPLLALVHDRAVLADRLLVDAIGAAGKLATANVRLQAELRAHARELRASQRRILTAYDAERDRLERRLDVGPVRTLREVAALLVAARRAAQTERVQSGIADAELDLENAAADLLAFARGVHPRVLAEKGLEAAVGSFVQRLGVSVSLAVDSVALPPEVETCIYFVCAEALANVAKHAAASAAAVSVVADRSFVVVCISDNGRGGAAHRIGSGLRGISDRVETLGGTLTIDSGAEGTRVTAQLPRFASAS